MQQIKPIKLGADGKFSSTKKLTEIYNKILQSSENEFKLDASRLYWVSPFTACWFAALYDGVISQEKTLDVIEPVRDNAAHQWHNLGISKYLGLSTEVKALNNLPAVPVERLTEPSYPLAGKVKNVLTSSLRGVENFDKAIHFAVREVIENSFEHGKIDHCYICAYSAPKNKIVRLCILDTGIGIPNSIRSGNKYSSDLSDVETVELASEQGVSSKEEDRGIGLYILRDVAEKNEGCLSILSGSALIEISSTMKRTNLEIGFPGTVIKMQLRTYKDFYYMDNASWEQL